MDYAQIKESFDQMYLKLLRERGRAFMEAQGTAYLTDDIEELRLITESSRKCSVNRVVGPVDGKPAAWLLDHPAGLGLVLITEGISVEELAALVRLSYGVSGENFDD